MTVLRDATGRFVKTSTGPVTTTVDVRYDLRKLIAASERAKFKNFGHAAARISKDAKASIEKADEPSAPGQPPHTHKGAFLRRAIRYAADKQGAVIGPMASIVGTSGQPHEHGGSYKGQTFAERPFMLPALQRNLGRFAGEWRGTIGA